MVAGNFEFRGFGEIHSRACPRSEIQSVQTPTAVRVTPVLSLSFKLWLPVVRTPGVRAGDLAGEVQTSKAVTGINRRPHEQRTPQKPNFRPGSQLRI